jgi:hypothetical protein
VRYLKVETEQELETLHTALELLVAGTRPGEAPGEWRHDAAEALRQRLHATPESRHVGLATTEDANHLPSAPARCEGYVRRGRHESTNGHEVCGLELVGGCCPSQQGPGATVQHFWY